MRASRIVISGKNDQSPHAQETQARSLFIGSSPHAGPAVNIEGLPTATKVVNGVTYSGTWKGEHRHGSGVQTWMDGFRYEGSWVDGYASGMGKLIFPSGDVYEGHFDKDQANGAGKLTRTDGSVSEGVWWDDELHGSGVQIWPDGSKYEGNFNRGKRQG